MLAGIKKKLLRATQREDKPASRRVVSLEPQGKSRGNVLLSYIIDPFLDLGRKIDISHTHFWESWQMAQTFIKHGFSVDVISYLNRSFIPEKKYDFFISARTNLERIAAHLDAGCVKVAHLDTAHWTYNNKAAYERVASLLERRGVVIGGGKCVEENWAVEVADMATILGNSFTIDTYAYSGKPIFRIPISVPCTYPDLPRKDYKSCRKNFIWFGSSGFVHKGLDLVLEAFQNMPEYTLYVCGPLEQEARFVEAYREALFETPNIKTVGWVDVESKEFIDIASNCIALVYPTCAEGGGGSVISCMHAGIIPVVSYQASVDIDEDRGRILKDCSIEEIASAVTALAESGSEELERMARNAREWAVANHTKERFAEEYENFVVKHLLV